MYFTANYHIILIYPSKNVSNRERQRLLKIPVDILSGIQIKKALI
jgi:hypothetical protein